MKTPPNSSEQALEDYFKDLLDEPVPIRGSDSTSFKANVVDAFSGRPVLAATTRHTHARYYRNARP
jgi:hypothetical protein